MIENTPSQLLDTASTLFAACLRRPRRNLAILKEARVAWLQFLEEIAANLPQCTDVCLVINVILAARFHLLLQVRIVLVVLLGHLTPSLSSTGFLLSGCSQLCLGGGRQRAIIGNRRFQGPLG